MKPLPILNKNGNCLAVFCQASVVISPIDSLPTSLHLLPGSEVERLQKHQIPVLSAKSGNFIVPGSEVQGASLTTVSLFGYWTTSFLQVVLSFLFFSCMFMVLEPFLPTYVFCVK